MSVTNAPWWAAWSAKRADLCAALWSAALLRLLLLLPIMIGLSLLGQYWPVVACSCVFFQVRSSVVVAAEWRL